MEQTQKLQAEATYHRVLGASVPPPHLVLRLKAGLSPWIVLNVYFKVKTALEDLNSRNGSSGLCNCSALEEDRGAI